MCHYTTALLQHYLNSVKGILHSKLALDLLADLKVRILENFYSENDRDWCRRYLDILGRNVLKDADV